MKSDQKAEKHKEIIELLKKLSNYLEKGEINIKYSQCGSKCCTCKYKNEPIIWGLQYINEDNNIKKEINLKNYLEKQKNLSKSCNKFELTLNGKNWLMPEANLTLWVCPSPSLKKCDKCSKKKENVMSSKLEGGSWLNYCWECSFMRLEELKTSGFLEETELLSKIGQSINNYNKKQKKEKE
ncbi:hypothetical protein [endosymbiont GvMRE of Glomus versiforme]|uniref:hypothetical protein n=1 Tax=endosymbiont GvMRE of Glomus versiforme TaxID=2039283 RepID=UPI000EC2A887|nr:hypothetical protein [endosymbiont GvMRE of Glomus versiforme]RHZ37133.1 hypothetical protein GvMRE_I1g286 [endosymbiont GvMRE of Glomus versiforme]